MSRARRALMTGLLLLTPWLANSRPQRTENAQLCAEIHRALADYQRITVGTPRQEIEKYFVRDGGAQFRQNSRYVYPQCSYLHIDVDFEQIGEEGVALSQKDKVVKISKIYVDYPAKD